MLPQHFFCVDLSHNAYYIEESSIYLYSWHISVSRTRYHGVDVSSANVSYADRPAGGDYIFEDKDKISNPVVTTSGDMPLDVITRPVVRKTVPRRLGDYNLCFSVFSPSPCSPFFPCES